MTRISRNIDGTERRPDFGRSISKIPTSADRNERHSKNSNSEIAKPQQKKDQASIKEKPTAMKLVGESEPKDKAQETLKQDQKGEALAKIGFTAVSNNNEDFLPELKQRKPKTQKRRNRPKKNQTIVKNIEEMPVVDIAGDLVEVEEEIKVPKETSDQEKSKKKKSKKSHFRSVVTMANTKLPVRFAAIVLASSTLISAILGIFRDRLLNSYYLDTYPTGIDAYTAAFTIPDFMFFILTSGALSVSFIPVFNQRLSTGNKKSAWELSSSLLNLMALITLIASILIMLLADPLVRYVVGPGLDESGTILAINMMRVIAINPFLFAISTILTSIQQALARFVFCALAPALYNVGILIGIAIFTNGINLFGWQIFEGGIMGVALGVVFGAILQLIVSLIGLFGLGFDYRFKMNWKNQGFRAVLKLLPARSLDQGIDYVNTLVTTNLSSRMGAGALRSYQQAYNLSQMPVSLIGVAISTAFFPKLTEEIGTGKEEKFRETFRSALSTIIWIALPVAAIALFARGYVVSFIKNGGDPLISSILSTLIVTIFANSVFHIASRGFYAHQDTKTPLIISIIAIGTTVLLAIIFSFLNCGPEGLGWAQSIGTLLEVVILVTVLQKRSQSQLLDKTFWKSFIRMLICAAATGLATYAMTKFVPLMAADDSIFIVFPKFCLICLVAFLVYLITGYFLKIKQVRPIIDRAKKIVFRNLG